MKQESIYTAIVHMKDIRGDAIEITRLLSSTLADVAEKISNDEMRRLLIVGGWIYSQEQTAEDAASETQNLLQSPSSRSDTQSPLV